jgi:methylated-DNA-[protein]-cysteine S-methyltransferase
MGLYVFPTGLGWMAMAYSPCGLARLVFGYDSARAARAALDRSGDTVSRGPPPAWVARLARKLAAYAEGRKVSFSSARLDLTGLTPFQRRVLAACRHIPRGSVVTYRQLAEAVGSPRAARAVGQCMAKNKFPLIVPCHRVVGSQGQLGGFSAPQGLAMKRRLLALETRDCERRSVKPKVRGSRGPVRRR